jgi:hypothetical protein
MTVRQYFRLMLSIGYDWREATIETAFALLWRKVWP